MRRALSIALFAVLAASCTATTIADEGARVAADPRYSVSLYNSFACATCHPVGAAAASGDTIYPGAPLAGALRRPSFWGGSVRTATDAAGLCFSDFMRGGPFDPTIPESVALYAYLESVADEGPTEAQPFTVPPRVVRLTGGDPGRGRDLYRRACAYCHGAPHTGEGRPRSERGTPASIVPDDTENEHNAAEGYDQPMLEAVFVQKVRHGSFYGYAGVMPPFSTEVLSDAQLADIVAYLAPALRP